MINPENINLPLQHMKWADSEIWRKILTLELVEPDVRIKKLLYHMHQVQYAFYYIWIGNSIEIPKPEEFSDLKSIINWGSSYYKLLNDFLNSPAANEPKRIIEIPWSKYFQRKTSNKLSCVTFEETVFHIASHSTYHRAQINTRLRELGIEPASIDFIIWVWLGKPKVSFDFI